MSEQDNFDAAVKQNGGARAPRSLHSVRTAYIGESRGREGALPAEKWRSLREAALATNHAKFNAADLDELMVGEVFLALVIRDPKVQAGRRTVVSGAPGVSRGLHRGDASQPVANAQGVAPPSSRTGRCTPMSATPN
jgi:hypothetical protein